MNRKLLSSLAIASALTLGACAGGGASDAGDSSDSSESAESAGPRTLLVWVDTVREPACKSYQESVAADIAVTCEVVGQEEILPKIMLSNQAGQGWPDVVFSPPNSVSIYAEEGNGYALNLDEYVDSAIIDAYNTSNDWCLIDGSYYCLKNDLAQTVLWYDTVIFDELGLTVPTTMEEFAETAMMLEGTDYVAGAIGDQGFYAGYLWPSGCPMADVQDGTTVRINADAPECTRVFDLMQPLVDAGVVETRSAFDAGFITEVAQQQKVAMNIGPSWWGEFVIRPADSWAIPEGRMAAAEMPKWDGESTAWSGEWGGGIWVVSSHAENLQDAADAGVYLATDPNMREDKVTFPGYQPAFEKWAARLGVDTYYASDPTVAMVAQASRIRQDNNPVRYDMRGQIGVLQTEINGGATLEDSTRTFMQTLVELAPSVGYTVID
jgi:ABC-type glycerol-3-phosphate transport system substrate-binding protein